MNTTEHSFAHFLGLVFYFFIFWWFLQLTYAAWGSRRARPGWIALVNTRFMQSIGIKWVSAICALAAAVQIMLVIIMLGVSAYTGKPIRFD